MEAVGEKLGIAKSSYNGYEKEDKKPPIDKLQKLALLYNVSTDYILGLTDDPDPKTERRNINEFLQKGQLHFDGVPVSEELLELYRKQLETMLRDQMPNKIQDHNNSDDNNNLLHFKSKK